VVSVIKAGGMLLISTFIIIVLYFTMSTPLEAVFTGFDDAEAGEATDEMDTYLTYIRNALNIAWAVALITPSVIFVLYLFFVEPVWTYRRRYFD